MPRPAMRLRIVPRFPARLQGDDGIEVTRSGGVVTIGQNWTPIQDGAPPDLASYEVLLRKPADGSFLRSPITDAVGTIVTWSTLTGKPSTFPPSSHTHPISQVDLLQATLDQKIAFSNVGTDAGDIVGFLDAGGGAPRYPAADGSLITGVAADISASTFTPPYTGGIATPLIAKFMYMVAPQEFGAVGNGVADDRNAVANWLNALMALTGRYIGIVMPAATHRIASALPSITRRITIQGSGLSSSSFIRDFTGTSGVGLFHLTADGGGNATSSKLSGFEVASSSTSTGGALISVVSTSSVAVSAITLEDLWLTTRGTDTHVNTLYFDGTAKTTGAIGVRDLCMRNVHVFGANGYSVFMNGVVQLDWVGGAVYPAGGTGTGTGAIQFNGTASVNTQQITAKMGTCGGLLFVNSQNCDLHIPLIGAVGGISVNNASSAANIMVYGLPSGTVLGNWSNSAIKRPGTSAFSAT